MLSRREILAGGTLAAENVAECCASNHRWSAWDGFRLAQSQYRTCLEMLALADELTPSQRVELHAALQHLSLHCSRLADGFV